jgi:hypothetical protein
MVLMVVLANRVARNRKDLTIENIVLSFVLCILYIKTASILLLLLLHQIQMDRLIGNINTIMKETETTDFPFMVMPEDSFVLPTLPQTQNDENSNKKLISCRLYSCPVYIYELPDGTIEYPLVETKMSRCSKCKSVRYCSKECQVSDWKRHKMDCATKTD